MPLNIFDFSSFPHFFFGLVCFGYAIVVAVKSWHINLHFDKAREFTHVNPLMPDFVASTLNFKWLEGDEKNWKCLGN